MQRFILYDFQLNELGVTQRASSEEVQNELMYENGILLLFIFSSPKEKNTLQYHFLDPAKTRDTKLCVTQQV